MIGWVTKRKIVVIESDDWGSIRMPSRQVYDLLLSKGIRVDNQKYSRYDSLASDEDLSELFNVLSSVRDKNGNPAKLTANCVMANPDFDKIRQSNFEKYYYEPFTETLKRYPAHSNAFNLWRKGMSEGMFQLQFHGREHLNVHRWMKYLQENIGNVRLAFDNRMFEVSESGDVQGYMFMDALNYNNAHEIEFQKDSIIEGTKLFETILGFKSKTFIAPCYIWKSSLNDTLFNCGIKAFQGSWYQFEPKDGMENRFRKNFHYTGQKNALGQVYIVRNAAFEPSQIPNIDWIDDILSRIKIAFRWNKPAIISAHRLNFVGFIDRTNRERNLILFEQLLKEIVRKWPDIEFLSTDQLVDLMLEDKIE